MTSRSLSFSEKMGNHKKYITRNLWTSIIGLLLMAAYYILGVIMLISRSINYAAIYNQSAELLYHYKCNAVGRILGFEQFGFLITIFIAIAFAFQGFSYVFDQKQLDFYMSQPTTRAQRLWSGYFKAFATYLAMYVIIEAIALIIAAAMGGVNNVVLVTALAEMVRNFILFFAVYNITLLAILLSGTFPIAVLVLLFFMFVSLIVGFELYCFKSIFYATFAYDESVGIIASPLFDRFSLYFNLKYMTNDFGYYWDFKGFYESLKAVIPGTVDTLITGIAALILVVVFSRYRRAEHAGQTIVYRPFRWLVKIIACVIVGLAAGYMVFLIYDYVWNDRLLGLMFIIMLFATVICGCVIEAILDSNVKKIFAGKAQTIMALAVVVLIFVIFKGDLLGYDSYIPNASRIESCNVTGGDPYYMYNYNYDVPKGQMEITDIENFTKLAEIGMKAQKEYKKLSRNNEFCDIGWSDVSIEYRLKNGREVYRNITIPYDIDEKLMSSIIDSEEYKKGYFAVFYDDEIRDADKGAYSRVASYSTSITYHETKEMPYSELSDAYRKDILEHYSFDMARNNLPVGQVEYSVEKEDEQGFISRYAEYRMDIYESYTNTIDVLKKYGIYSENTLDVEYIENVCVTNYYPGIDISGMDQEQLSELDVKSKEFTYTDPEQIKEILTNACANGYYGRWFDYHNHFDNQYGIEVNLSRPVDQYGTTSAYYEFLLGKVPEFVVEDTN
ncbi:MAG: DUF6449 domain-containing protein [Butyrivibrio sp.]|nr:DUF6449 domain-containing protein [Butyrivibrio sp.]